MKTTTCIFILLVGLPVAVNADLRCKRSIISKGDHKYIVSEKIKKCGVILSKEVMQYGYTAIKTEEWFIKINKTCYSINFTNGTLHNISSGNRCR